MIMPRVPALAVSRANLSSAFRDDGGRTGAPGHEQQRSQNVLVIAQVALASILLIGAGLLARNFLALQTSPLGFNTHHILTADIYLADTKYAEGSRRKVFFDTLLDRARLLPGVLEAGLNDTLPFYSTDFESLSIVGQPVSDRNQLPGMARQIVARLPPTSVPGHPNQSDNGLREKIAVVLGERLWRGRFHADPKIVGNKSSPSEPVLLCGTALL
jgi:hypothetical protein